MLGILCVRVGTATGTIMIWDDTYVEKEESHVHLVNTLIFSLR